MALLVGWLGRCGREDIEPRVVSYCAAFGTVRGG